MEEKEKELALIEIRLVSLIFLAKLSHHCVSESQTVIYSSTSGKHKMIIGISNKTETNLGYLM